MSASPFSASNFAIQYDCPTDTVIARRLAGRFRRLLLSMSLSRPTIRASAGMALVQCGNPTQVAARVAALRAALPPDGRMAVTAITEAQIGRTQISWGRGRKTDPATHTAVGAM